MSSLDLAPNLVERLSQPDLHIHLLGVSGSGMSGLARLLLDRGYAVTGSDLQETATVRELIAKGLRFYQGHDSGRTEGIDLIAYSSAISPTNIERVSAREVGIPQVRRADLLAALTRAKRCLVVAGTHGKTTTSAMLTMALQEAGFNPSFYIGADVPSLGRNAAWTDGAWMVLEVDESDGSLSAFDPQAAIILNIEEEHLDHFESLEQIEEVFLSLAKRTSGRLVYCHDDPIAKGALSGLPNAVGYGFGVEASWRVEDWETIGGGSTFYLEHAQTRIGPVRLTIPGRHNVSNAAAVLSMALGLGAGVEEVVRGLNRFGGASRRFEIKIEDRAAMIVDDYAHHPSEVRATLEAARARASGRVLAVFQPHRYSRTQALKDAFAGAFDQADAVVFTDIYPASEEPLPGVDGRTLPDAVRAAGHPAVEHVPSLKGAKARIAELMMPGDLVLVMGAGNVHWIASELGRELKEYVALRELADLEDIIRVFEPMRKHTTLRLGGPAQIWFEPASEESLIRVVSAAKEMGLPVTLIGRGSNLLVQDLGVRGLCVHLGRPYFQRIEVDGTSICAGGGARLKQIVSDARKAGLTGFEFMEGIPGNLGGALRMNAGAMGSWMFERVESIRVWAPDGTIRELTPEEMVVEYRNVPLLKDHVVLSAKLTGEPASETAVRERLAEFSQKRWSSQPAAPSAGCTFKNPGMIPAGKLIEELGLKGRSIGGARISPVHGNFIVNDGGATAADVLALMDLVRNTAEKERGISLEAEVIILGETL
jgi:UDP-N-acetylmuramate--L-alanine ligase/UDP-N-acetylenolpyruvoylglucosamine reductase